MFIIFLVISQCVRRTLFFINNERNTIFDDVIWNNALHPEQFS